MTCVRCRTANREGRRSRALLAAALTLVLLGSSPTWAGPTERLQDFFAAVNAILADPETEDRPLERVARIRPLVAEVSDVNAAAAAALGGEWRVRSRGEQDEFVTLFAELLERAYIGRLAGTARVIDGVPIAFLGESVAGDEATVQTSLGARDGGRALIEYRMVNRQGRWRVRDLVLDGVSTVENYRAQFRRLLSQVSFQDLVGQVKAKLGAATIMFAHAVARSAPALAPALTELVPTAPPDDRTTESDRRPPVVQAAVTDVEPLGAWGAVAATRPREAGWRAGGAPAVRSRDVGWSVGDATAVRSRDIGWIVGDAAASAASYWVQVGTFKTAAAAGRLAERLGEESVVSSASGSLLRVRVGPFAQRAQAVSKLRDLEAIGYHPLIAEARD